MKPAIDASVLVRLIIGEPLAQAKAAADLIREKGPVVCNDVVFTEVWFALKEHYGFKSSEALLALRTALESGAIIPEPHSGIEAALTEGPGKAGFVDRLLVGKNASMNLITFTFDHAQGKLPNARRIAIRP